MKYCPAIYPRNSLLVHKCNFHRKEEPHRCRKISVIGENLFVAQTPIFVELGTVRLEGVLAAQSLCEEIRSETEIGSTDGIEVIGARIPQHARAKGRKVGVESDLRRDRKFAISIWPDCNDRVSVDKSRADEEFPADAAQAPAKNA